MSFLSKSRPAKSLVRTDEATAVILNEQSFRYPEKTVKARRDHANVHDLLSEEKNQLKDISMKIQPGETVLIYGRYETRLIRAMAQARVPFSTRYSVSWFQPEVAKSMIQFL